MNPFDVYEYPWFVLVRQVSVEGQSVTFHDMVNLDIGDDEKALAIFTDKEGAEEFRDNHCPGHQLFPIPDIGVLTGVLLFARSGASHMAFDPWRAGKKFEALRIDDLFRNGS
jgi:hypothetical protein